MNTFAQETPVRRSITLPRAGQRWRHRHVLGESGIVTVISVSTTSVVFRFSNGGSNSLTASEFLSGFVQEDQNGSLAS